MSERFSYDVFLSYSPKDKSAVVDIAERLKKDGLQIWLGPSGSDPSNLEEGLESSRVMVLCVSANALGSEWARLESASLRFRDPVNKHRRFILLRLDGSSIKESLAQFPCINLHPSARKGEYPKLLDACRLLATREEAPVQAPERAFPLGSGPWFNAYAFSPDGRRFLIGGQDEMVRLWDVETERCLRVLEGHWATVSDVAWSADQAHALSASEDGKVFLWHVESGRCLRQLEGHTERVQALAWSSDGLRVLSGDDASAVRLWDARTGLCLRILKGHRDDIWSLAWGPDGQRAISSGLDRTIRLWDLDTGRCIRVFEGHTKGVAGLAWSADERLILSGSWDNTVRLWDVDTGRCLRVLEGHTGSARKVSWSADQRLVVSGELGGENDIRVWDVENGRVLRVLKGHAKGVVELSWSARRGRLLSADKGGGICVWDLSDLVARDPAAMVPASLFTSMEVQYTNAKVLLVGDTSSGKTGLANRLATGEWKPSDGSTVGAWSTQWKLPDLTMVEGLEREIWLWDFGGQADQRLVHQLYMDRSALVLLLFDADKEDVLPGLREWQTALRRSVPAGTRQFLVAGRIDAGFKASRSKLQNFAKENGFEYHETSAKEGLGCSEIREAIVGAVPWSGIERRTSPRVFKLIKDAILKLRDEGQVLHTFKELREMLWQRLSPDEPRFTDEVLQTVIGLLDGPGAVRELEYGTYILLQPEWINAYAQAVIRTLRQEPSELGCLPLRSIAEGKLLFQTVGRDGAIENMKRLPAHDERIVLGEMERQLEERGLCLRQGDKLVFPSHCGRDRPAVVKHPSVFVSYAIEGYLDDIYATLVVKLAASESFKLTELWRDAADFLTLAGDHHMGIKLTREGAGNGGISVYFAPGVTKEEQVIFANYIHAHLESRSEKVQRLRYYVCPHCHTPKGNPEVLMQKLEDKKTLASVECDRCEKRFDLWDELEKKFASQVLRAKVEGLQASDAIRLDARRKGKLLALEVGARITSADYKCFEIPLEADDGLDMELEFTDEKGHATGKRLYLQLKSGNSHLETRKKDGVEIFRIHKQRWVDYWMQQPYPVMLVIGTFAEDRMTGKDKLEFADVRWMEITSVLKRAKKPVKQIEFKGERLDLTSLRKWRDRIMA